MGDAEMNLHPDWKAILKKAHSIRVALAGMLLASGDQLLPQLDGIVPKWLYLLLFGAFIVTRIYQQGNMNGGR